MKLITLILISLSCGCMTFKEVKYTAKKGSVIIVIASPVEVSGSDAQDSLNGNNLNPELSLPIIP